MDLEYLEKRIQETPGYDAPIRNDESTKIYRFVFYLVPTFSNPSSSVVNLNCREELIIVGVLCSQLH